MPKNKLVQILETPTGECPSNLLSLDGCCKLLQAKIDEAMERGDFKASIRLGKSLTTCHNQQRRTTEKNLVHRSVAVFILETFIASIKHFEPRFKNHPGRFRTRLPGSDDCSMSEQVIKSRRMFDAIVGQNDCDVATLCSCTTLLVGAIKSLVRSHEQAPAILTVQQVNQFIRDMSHEAGLILAESYGFENSLSVSINHTSNVVGPALALTAAKLYGDKDGQVQASIDAMLTT